MFRFLPAVNVMSSWMACESRLLVVDGLSQWRLTCSQICFAVYSTREVILEHYGTAQETVYDCHKHTHTHTQRENHSSNKPLHLFTFHFLVPHQSANYQLRRIILSNKKDLGKKFPYLLSCPPAMKMNEEEKKTKRKTNRSAAGMHADLGILETITKRGR
jgi:hypothetical protein